MMEILCKDIPGVHYKDTSQKSWRKIRVLQIITALGTGGATNVVLDIADHLNKHPDFEVELLTGPIPKDRTDLKYQAYERGITPKVLPKLINQLSPMINAKAVLDIRRIIIQENYDIIHTHSSVAGIVGRLAARAAGARVIVHHVHGWGLHEKMSQGMRILYLGLERICARLTDRIITVSKSDIKKAQTHRIAKRNKFKLIYNGIELEKFRHPVDDQIIRSELGLDPDCKLVGMIGRLDEQKNPLDLIRTAAIVIKDYSKVQFLILGDGPLQSECELLIRKLNLQGKFFLLGFRKDISRIVPILTITALSSLWEGLPLVFLESMSAGKPIVANNVDGASDIIIDGETGFLVTPHRPSEMAEHILYLLKNNEVCNQMANVARQRSHYFSRQRMVEQIESLYRELLINSNHIQEKQKINQNLLEDCKE